MAKPEKRFIIIEKSTMIGAHVVDVICDRQTRVEYVSFTVGTGGGSLTPLLDTDGKPLLYDGPLD